MAKSVNEWYKIIEAQYVTEMAAVGVEVDPSTWSQANHQRIFLYTMAVVAYIPGVLQDLFRAEVEEVIANKNPHTGQWYVNKAKDFQYGFSLVPEKDYYDNTGIAPNVIAASKIVAYAAFVEEPFVRLKVAKLAAGKLAKLNPADELPAFQEYVRRYRDAGVKLKPETITSTDPDKLRLKLRVKYDPLVLNTTGARIDGTESAPVPAAIDAYLSNIDFNGLFSVQKLVDEIQKVDGVNDLHIDSISTKYGALPFKSVDIDFVPDAGYLIIDPADLNITYIPS